MPKKKYTSPVQAILKKKQHAQALQALVEDSFLKKGFRDSQSANYAAAIHRMRKLGFFTPVERKAVAEKLKNLPSWYVPFGALRFYEIVPPRISFNLFFGIVHDTTSPETAEKSFYERLEKVTSLFIQPRIIEDDPHEGCFHARLYVSSKIIHVWGIPGEASIPAAIVYHSLQVRNRNAFRGVAKIQGFRLSPYGLFKDGIFIPLKHYSELFLKVSYPPDYLEKHYQEVATGAQKCRDPLYARYCKDLEQKKTLQKLKRISLDAYQNAEDNNTLTDNCCSDIIRGDNGPKNTTSRDKEARAAIRRAIKRLRQGKNLCHTPRRVQKGN